MKKSVAKCFGILTAVSLLAGMGTSLVYAETNSFSLGETKTVIALNEAGNFVEGCYGSTAIADLEGVVYTSDNEDVLEVSEAGEIVEKNYGSAVVTAEYQGEKASILITVTPKNYSLNGPIDQSGYSYEDEREVKGGYRNDAAGTSIGLTNIVWSNFSGLTSGRAPFNTMTEAWFYDNGQTTDAEAGIACYAYQSYAGTGVVGVLQSADTTYKISGITNYNPNTAYIQLLESHITNAEDTGITRSKGWHQVSLVGLDQVGSFKLYLDGTLIKTFTFGASPGIIFAYAGTDTNHSAKFKFPAVAEYRTLSNVSITENAGTLSAGYTYNSTSGSAQYKWYYSDSPEGVWNEIPDAAFATYTPEGEYAGKWIRAGIKISDTAYTGEQFTTNEAFTEAKPTFSGVFSSISLSENASLYEKGAAGVALTVVGSDANGLQKKITDLSDVSFTSDKPEIVSVDDSGNMSFNNYGSATIKAIKGELKASILITVTPKNYSLNGPIDQSGYSYEDEREVKGGYRNDAAGTSIGLTNIVWSNFSGLTSGRAPFNTMTEAWFYDNGQTTDAEAGIACYAYQSYAGTGVVGVLQSADTTYKISGITNYNPNTAYIQLLESHITNAEDTGITRSKGWHQVSLVGLDQVGSFKLYLDGTLIKTFEFGSSPGIIFAYAGTDSNHSAKFKLPAVAEYRTLSNVSVAAEGIGNLSAEYTYNGTEPTAQYNWYYADSADSANWTKIDGADQSTYTVTDFDKYYRVGVTVTDKTYGDNPIQFTTAEVYSEALKPVRVVGTDISYSDGTVTISSSEEIKDGILLIPEYVNNNGYKRLVSIKTYPVNCKANASSSISVGTLQSGQTLMLWESMNTMRPLCAAKTVE